ncbi:MAG TPA: hypothetical protein DDW93_00480 [Firmicutes bacterium]|jgi:tetratricopeptide (TPR) repeat protein|nr:hypothetical protein [Bacillota bacterium]HBT17749.1 hypothetical protein [Bacillota bacterium]
MMMRNFRKTICIIIVFLMILHILPVTASSERDDASKTYLKVGVTAALVVGAVVAIRSTVVNSKAGRHYQQGDLYAAEGRWDLAVQSYTEALRIKPKYKDVAVKLETAKLQAEKMFLQKGDDARRQEKLEEAEQFYQQALGYVPTSTQTRKKLADLSQELVAVYYRRGLSYETVNRWDEALSEYEKAYLLDPHYLEVATRYQMARTRVKGNLPLKTVLFFINKTSTPGVEEHLARELQTQMGVQARGAYVMLDYGKVGTILTEQAEALSKTLDQALAMDIGRLLGVDEVIIGEFSSIETKNRIKIKVSAQVLKVPSGQISKEVKPFSYTFSKKVDSSNWWLEIPQLAEDLAKRINK